MLLLKKRSTYVVWVGLMGAAVVYSLLMMKYAPNAVAWIRLY